MKTLKSIKEAFKYYYKAYKLLDFNGLYGLKRCYENGYGDENLIREKEVYKKLCDAGNSEACFNNEDIYKLVNFFKDLNKKFNKNYPTSIDELKRVKKLNLCCNKLKSIPKEIGNLSNLQELNLWNNKLESIPKEIGNLSNLKELYLSINKLNNTKRDQ